MVSDSGLAVTVELRRLACFSSSGCLQRCLLLSWEMAKFASSGVVNRTNPYWQLSPLGCRMTLALTTEPNFSNRRLRSESP